jgi:hypothetical protein
VDYLGAHQQRAVDLEWSVADNGVLRIGSGSQRFYEGPIAFEFPLLFSGVAEVCGWHDDQRRRLRSDVNVTDRTLGRLFGYSGHFDVEWVKVEPSMIPATILLAVSKLENDNASESHFNAGGHPL